MQEWSTKTQHMCDARGFWRRPQVYCTKNQRWTLNPAFDKAFLLPLSNSVLIPPPRAFAFFFCIFVCGFVFRCVD